jgi:hypothetical protein
MYDDPANAGLAWDEGYVGTTYLTYEVFEALDLDFPKDKEGRLRDLVEQGMDKDLWCKADPYGMTHAEQLQFSWEEFCRVIKHERRYFFLQNKNRKTRRPYDDELLGPADMLDTIFSFAETEGGLCDLAGRLACLSCPPSTKRENLQHSRPIGPAATGACHPDEPHEPVGRGDDLCGR